MSVLLIVDDRPQARELLVAGLKSYGFDRILDCDAGEALDAVCREVAIHAIVLAVESRQANRRSLIPKIRHVTQVPIIMVSDGGDLAARVAALAAGADDYFTKPFDIGELASRINSLLRRPRLRERR